MEGFPMPEVTEKYVRIPVKKPKKNAVIRTITLGKGIKALYDVKNKVILTYLFPTKKYTMKQAKEWIKKHKSNFDFFSQVAENKAIAARIRTILNDC
jgi:hypothetical protein